MAREETIKIIVDKSTAEQSFSKLKEQADALKNTLSSVKVGDASQALNTQATAASAVTKAEKEATNAANLLNASHQTLGKTVGSLTAQYLSLRSAINYLRQAFRDMREISDQLAEYRKVTGATEQEMERLRDTAYSVAKAYGESASSVIASAANMARAGYKENAMQMAELATKTKLVGNMTQEAADKFLIAVDAAYKYKGNVEQLSSVLDAASAIDSNFATTLGDIGDGITLVASLASSANVPIEQLMAALGTMSAVTQRSGNEVARGLRSILLSVMGDTTTEIEEGVTATEESVKSMTDALLKYGDASVKAAIQAGKVINPMEAIVALQKAWKENQITEQDLYQISNDVAGKRYYNIFTALIQNPEMYNEMLQSIADSVGNAQSKIDAIMDSWSKKLENLKTTWTELVNESITEGFIKNLIDGGTAALEFAGSLENLALMAGGALAALKSLTTGGSGFITTAALATAAIGALKTLQENQYKTAVTDAQSAVKASESIVKSAGEMTEIIAQYKELSEDGIDNSELSEAETIQGRIKTIIGEQADAYDILNGKIEDNIALLKTANAEYVQGLLTEAKTQTANAAAALKGGVGEGTLLSPATSTGRYTVPTERSDREQKIYEYVIAELSKYSSAFAYTQNGETVSTFNFAISSTGRTLDDILEYYTKITQLQELYADLYTAEELSGDSFYAGVGNTLEKMKPLVEAYTTALQNQYRVEAELILIQDDFSEKTFETEEALNAYIDALSEANGLTDDQKKALSELAKTTTALKKSTDDASGSMGGMTTTVDSLTKSIERATDAKKAFDDAMATSKADAFNDYMEAFDTFKGELDAGRVNSTAMYAAARMILGEDAYNATGGTYAGVMAAMNRAGSAGSVLDAYNILNAKYQDENGTAVEGFGVYELIRKSGLYSENQLHDKEGNYYLPEMTTDDISRISAAYGGILEEVIINALNALDQYDIYGSATDTGLSVGEKKEEEATAEEEVIDSMKQMTKATDTATESASDLATEMGNAAEAAAEFTAAVTTSEGGGRSNKSGTWKETASSIWGGVKDAFAAANEATKAAAAEKTAETQQKAAEAAQSAADSLNNAIATLNTLNATGGNADIIAMLNGLNNLKETYEIAIEAVGGTGTTEEKLAAIAEALNTVDSEKEIAVSVGLPGTEEGYEAVKAALLAEANGLIADVNDEDTLHEIACTLVADDGTVLNKDIDDLLRARQKDVVTVQVEANTAPAILQIGMAEISKYHAKIGVSADTDDAIEKISGVEEGEYSATVNVAENGAEEAQTAIQTVADDPYNAKINVKESGTATARKRIADTADAEYNATIHVDDNGTTQTVIDKIDTALEKLGYVEDVDVDPEIEDLVEDLNAIKESYTVSIKDGKGTKSTSTLIRGISNALKTIDELKDAGVIDVEFATETSDALLEEANAIIGAVNSDEELEEIWIALEGDDYPITKEIFDILHKKRDSLRLNVSANTGEAETAISKVESGPYKADVNVGDGGTASETQTGIQTVADGPYEATINTAENGSSDAQTKIKSVANGPYDASVNASDNGTAAAVQEKIDAITGKDVGITLSVENESDFTSKVDELTKPETKTINIEYNEPPAGIGSAAQNSGSEEEYNNPVGAQEHIPQVPDNLLAGIAATVIDKIFGTNLYDGLPKHDNPEEPPTYDDGYFRPVTPDLVEEVNAQREAEEEAAKASIKESVAEGIADGIEEGVGNALTIAEPNDLIKGAAEYYWTAFKANGGDSEGHLWDQIVAPYLKGREDLAERLETAIEQLTEADNWEQLALPDDWWNDPVTVEVDADTSEAEEKAEDLVEEIEDTHATITVDVATPNVSNIVPQSYGGGYRVSDGAGGGGGGHDGVQSLLDLYGAAPRATGTQDHPGGMALVNDGNGPELLVDRGRAFIANDGKPALVYLNKNAKVFTASETREILGNGVPSYSFGTGAGADLNTYIANGKVQTRAVKSNTVETGSNNIKLRNVSPVTETAEEASAAATAAAQAASATFSSLKDLIDYVIDRIGLALDEQVEIIDKQIAELKAQREAAEQQNELEEKRKNLADALGNRTVRYIDENGQWHWMADVNKVQKAQKDLADYEDELAFNAQVDALEAQKTALQDQYKEITKAWSDIQYAVNTPTGDLYQMLAEVIATGSDTDKKGAETVQNLLITQLLKGGIFSGNYEEALDSIEKATAGNPIMPGESESTLASLIATATGTSSGTELQDALKATAMGPITGGMVTNNIINNNGDTYNIAGVTIAAEKAESEPMSSVLKGLAVYSNTGVV